MGVLEAVAMLWNCRRALKIWGPLTAFICVLLYFFSPPVRSSESHVGSSKQTRDIYVPAKVYRVYVSVDQDRRWTNRSSLVRLPQPPPPLIRRGDTKNVLPPDVQYGWANGRKVRPPRLPLPPARPRAPPPELSRGPVWLDHGVPSLPGMQAPNGETHSAWSKEAQLRREERRAVRARNHASFMKLQAGGTLSPFEKALYSQSALVKPRAPPNADTFEMYAHVPSENRGPYQKNDEVAPLRSQYDWNEGADSMIRDSVTLPPRDLDVDKNNAILRTKFSDQKVDVVNQVPEVKRSAWANFDADPDGPPVSHDKKHRLWKDLLSVMRNRKEPKNYAQSLSIDKQGTAQHPVAKPPASPNTDTSEMYNPSEDRRSYPKNGEVAPLRSQYNGNRGVDSMIRDSVTLPPRDLDVDKNDIQNSVLRTKFSSETVNVMSQVEEKRNTGANTFNPDGPPVSRNEEHRLWKDLFDAMHDRKESKFSLNYAQTLPIDKQSQPAANSPSSRAEILSRGGEPWMNDIDSLLRDTNQDDLSRHNTQQSRDVMSFGSRSAAQDKQSPKEQQNVASIHTEDPQSVFQPVDIRNVNSLPQNTFDSPHDTEKPTALEQDLKTSAPSQRGYFSIRNSLIKKRSSKRKTPALFKKIKKAGSPLFVDNSLPSEQGQDNNRGAVETKRADVDTSSPVTVSKSQVAHRELSLADFHTKTRHSSNQQAIPNGDAKAIDIQVTPKVDAVSTPSETSPNATKCATIPKAQGHVMALSYFDQITTSVRRIASLQCWAGQLGMTVVEPAFRGASFGAPKTRTSIKFSDLFDVLDWNDLMSQNCYTPLKRWDDFLYHRTTRSLILVQLVYPQGPPKGIFGELMDCSFTHLQEYYNKVLKPVGFTIARKLCIDFSRQPYISSEDFKRRILGSVDSSGVTVLFNQWRGICSGARCPGSHLVTLTDSSCSYNSILPSLLDFLTPSEQLFRDAQSYVVQKMNAASEYGAVMLRWERVPYTQQCISNILEQWTTLASSANMATDRQTFLATDIGRFGSYELKKNGIPNYIFQETEKLLQNLFRKPMSFDDYEQSFLDVATTSNPGYVSLLQKTISAQARCLLLVGRGVFQEHTLHMFKQLQPENHCYKMIARC